MRYRSYFALAMSEREQGRHKDADDNFRYALGEDVEKALGTRVRYELARNQIAEGDPTQRKVSRRERGLFRLWARIVSSERSLARVRGIAALLQRPLVRGGRIRRVPVPLFSRWTRNRDFPGLAPRSFHQLWESELKSKRPDGPS